MPSRDQEGKFVGLWSGTPKRKPDFEDRHRFRVLSSVPWNYYSEDFDPDKPPQELQSRPEPISSERSEELDEWRDWRRNGGFSHWP